jgi:hypothetical protein
LNDNDVEKATQRSDFIRRLFAVTVSVGFASQVNKLLDGSISGGRLLWGHLILEHGHQLWLLLISVIAVVASWDGYLASMRRKPVIEPIKASIRFYIDVLIVFTYLILMLLSQVDNLWSIVLAVIFVLYLAWDVVGAFEQSSSDMKRWHENSAVITALWLLFFIFLAYHTYFDNRGFGLTSAAALLAIILYRLDKQLRAPLTGKVGLLVGPVFCSIAL